MTARCNLLKILATVNWGADFNTLKTSAVSLCHSVAEYCSLAWSGSLHCTKPDVSLSECMRLISGCIKSTPTEILPILSGIEPSDLRKEKQLLNLYNRSKAPSHPMHVIFDYHYNHRLKSRNPVSIRKSELINRIQTPDHVHICNTIRIRGNIDTVDNDFKDWLNDNTLLTL